MKNVANKKYSTLRLPLRKLLVLFVFVLVKPPYASNLSQGDGEPKGVLYNLHAKSLGEQNKKRGRSCRYQSGEDLRSLSADIISKACFGSNYSQGVQIFSKFRALQNMISKRIMGIPILCYQKIKISDTKQGLMN